MLPLALALLGCAATPRPAVAPSPGAARYTVQSYNVECGEHRDASIIDAVGAARADIVCLQETTPQYEAVLRPRYAAQYPFQLYRHNEPDTGAAGLAILSRFPVIDRGHHPSPMGWHPAWTVEVDTPSGSIQILLVHLRAKLSGRSNDLSALLNLRGDHRVEIQRYMRFTREGRPTLVVGDFNEEGDGAAVEWLEARGFRDVLPLFRPDQHTWRHPVLAWELGQTLDHILFDPAFRPLDARVIAAGHSDHLPVVASLEVVPGSPWQEP